MAAQVLAIASGYSHILFPATPAARTWRPRGRLLDVGQVSDITKVESADTFERPIYAGNAIATVQATDAGQGDHRAHHRFRRRRPRLAAVLQSKRHGCRRQRQESFRAANSPEPPRNSPRPRSSSPAAAPWAAGEKFNEVMTPLADKLGAPSAPAARGGRRLRPNDWQVGQTGKIVAPQLYMRSAFPAPSSTWPA